MIRLKLVAALAIAGFVLVPIAPANAERASGQCTFEGRAVFSREYLKVLPARIGYEFRGYAHCEVLPSREKRTGIVEVSGEESLSCAGSLGEGESKGTLTLGALKLPFGLTFISGAPGATALAAKFSDGGVALGSATFLGSQSEPASQCFVLKGAQELEFTAAAVGEF
jgi:hypothetical protein